MKSSREASVGIPQDGGIPQGASRRDRVRRSPFGEEPLFKSVPDSLYGVDIPHYTQLEATGFSLQGILEARKNQELADLVMVFVGVRDKGLGAAGLISAAAQGAIVVGVSRQPAESEAVSRLMNEASNLSGREALWIPADLTDDTAPEKIIGTTLERFGRIDGMVMAVAHRDDRMFTQFTRKEIERELDVNQKGPLLVMHEAVKQMVKQRSGRYVYISSVAAAQTAAQPFYAAPKGFFESLIKDVAYELNFRYGEGKININALVPGLVPGTDLVGDVGEEQAKDILRATAAERGLLAAEVGEALAHLLNPKMDKTGKIISMVGKGPEPKLDENGLMIVVSLETAAQTAEQRRGTGQNETRNFLAFSDMPEYRREVEELLEQVFEDLPDNFVWTDVASGTGLGEELVAKLSEKYQKHGTIIGIEPDDFAVKEARERVKGNEYCSIEFIQGYGEDLDKLLRDRVADGSADVVSILDAIHEFDEENKMVILQQGKSKLKPGSGRYVVNSAFTTIGMGDAGMKYGRWRQKAIELAGLERDRSFTGPATVIHKPSDYIGMFAKGLGMVIVYDKTHHVSLSRQAIEAISRYHGFTEGMFEGTKPKEGKEAPSGDEKTKACIDSLDFNNIASLPREWLRIIAQMPGQLPLPDAA